MVKKLLLAAVFGVMGATAANASVTDDSVAVRDLTFNEMEQIDGKGGYPYFVTSAPSTYIFQWDAGHTHSAWVGPGYWTAHYVNTGVQVQMQCGSKVRFFPMPNSNYYLYC